ncbi:MAG TPA: FAD binding domain-containing protein [Gaiellaceae bacterium]|nr:FAD binding domain-containing protein [Gaiellaceae bacterium]
MSAPGATLPPFELHRPARLLEACRLLAEHGSEAQVYAGGTELLLVLRAGLADARHLVDVKRLAGLTSVWRTADSVRIGGAVAHARVAAAAEVGAVAPALVEAESRLGNVRVRSTGTLGGNLCFAEPHGDPATVLLAHDARVALESVRGARTVALDELLVAALETARDPDEILTHVELPRRRFDGAAYVRHAYAERPTAGVAVLLDGDDGRARDVRVAVGCIGPRPLRVREAEQAAEGLPLDAADDELERVGEAAAAALDPISDGYGPADFKRRLTAVLVARALRRACARAGTPDGRAPRPGSPAPG